MIYLDNNATTRIAPEVRNAILPFLDERYANPSSPYTLARTTAVALADAREQAAELLRATPTQLIFTSGGSESINTAFHAAATLRPERRHAVISTVEHAATIQCARRWEAQGGRVTRVPVDADGRLDLDAYQRSLTPDTALVSLMAANNETGVCFPVHELAAQAAGHDIWFHCDATQAIGKIPFNAGHPAFAFTSISGHKFHAPKGIGALTVRSDITLPPLIVGGEQEQGRRAGTENVIGIVGLGAAARLAESGPAAFGEHIEPLRQRLEEELLKRVDGVEIVGRGAPRLPNTSMLLFEGVESEPLLALLDMEGFSCSAGSACSSGATEPSPVLAAMGIPRKSALGAVRISLSRYTSADEVETFLDCIPRVIRSLRPS